MRRRVRRGTRPGQRAGQQPPTTCRRRRWRTAGWRRSGAAKHKASRSRGALGVGFLVGPWTSGLLEVDPLDHGKALQETPQAIEGQFNGAQSDPFAPAEDAGTAEFHAIPGSNADPDGAAEVH